MTAKIVAYVIQTKDQQFVYCDTLPGIDGDCEPSLLAILTYSKHRQCWWHIKENAEDYAKSLNGQFGELTVVPLTIGKNNENVS